MFTSAENGAGTINIAGLFLEAVEPVPNKTKSRPFVDL